jgi:hypothetical protein
MVGARRDFAGGIGTGRALAERGYYNKSDFKVLNADYGSCTTMDGSSFSL